MEPTPEQFAKANVPCRPNATTFIRTGLSFIAAGCEPLNDKFIKATIKNVIAQP
jgi:hypothetical protein